METMFSVLIGVAILGLIIWNIWLSLVLKRAEVRLDDQEGAIDGALAFMLEALERVIALYDGQNADKQPGKPEKKKETKEKAK